MRRATRRTRPDGGRDELAPSIEAPASLVAWRLDVERHAFALLAWPLPPQGLPDDRGLSAAEAFVATLAAAGRSNAEIARERDCSTRTVANQMASVFRKLGVHSRAELSAAIVVPKRRMP